MTNKYFFYLASIVILTVMFSCSSDDDDDASPEDNIKVLDISTTIDENPRNGYTIAAVSVEKGGQVMTDLAGFSVALADEVPAGALSIQSPQTGEYTLTVADSSKFDYETNTSITATVVATSGDETYSAPIVITLTDVGNENKIEFIEISVTIDENPSNGEVLATVSAEEDGNPITDLSAYSLSIISETPSGAMSIQNPTSGEYTINVADRTKFDYETNTSITATLEASANGETFTAPIVITLNNVPELQPIEEVPIRVLSR